VDSGTSLTGHDGADTRAFDHHGIIVAKQRAVEDVVGCDRELHYN
jgi:hypothetical protein